MLSHWNFLNVNSNRIWVAWNPTVSNVLLLKETDQIIHVLVTEIKSSKTREVSFIYGLHTPRDRRSMWRDLLQISNSSNGTPWMATGDFNEVLDPREIFGGNQVRDQGIDEFNYFVNQACLADLRYTGIYFTWSNRRFARDESWIELLLIVTG